MGEEGKEEQKLFQTVISQAEDLLNDPLSDLARKRQSSLIIVSIITILASINIIITDISVAGVVRLQFANQRILIITSCLVMFYYLILYFSTAGRDLVKWKAMMSWKMKDWGKLSEEQQEENQITVEIMKKLQDDIHIKIEERKDFNNKMVELESKLGNMPTGEREEILRPYRELLETAYSLKSIEEDVNLVRYLSRQMEKRSDDANTADTILRRYKFYSRVNLFTEFAFPALLSLSSSMIAITSLLRKL